MAQALPRSSSRFMSFAHGTATGMSHHWHGGQYCSILTPVGIVGCGIYDLKTAADFDMAIAIARGTPSHPLCEPEDLLQARIVELSPMAEQYGVKVGMTGTEAVEQMLRGQPLLNT